MALMQAALGLETALAPGDSGGLSELDGIRTAEPPFATAHR